MVTSPLVARIHPGTTPHHNHRASRIHSHTPGHLSDNKRHSHSGKQVAHSQARTALPIVLFDLRSLTGHSVDDSCLTYQQAAPGTGLRYFAGSASWVVIWMHPYVVLRTRDYPAPDYFLLALEVAARNTARAHSLAQAAVDKRVAHKLQEAHVAAPAVAGQTARPEIACQCQQTPYRHMRTGISLLPARSFASNSNNLVLC